MSKLEPLALALLVLFPACAEEAGAGAPPGGEPAEEETSAARTPGDGNGSEAPAELAGDEPEPADAVERVAAFIEEQDIDTAAQDWRTRLPKPPQAEFDEDATYHWRLDTNVGPLRIRLMPDVAPMHVTSTIYLTKLGFYDGLTFHRVLQGFMAQGGCPLDTGTGNPGYQYAGEFDPGVRHDRPGLLSMANAGPGTDGSQFFITFAPASHLDGNHTIFGEVSEETMDTLEALEARGARGGAGRPTEPLRIEKATIETE